MILNNIRKTNYRPVEYFFKISFLAFFTALTIVGCNGKEAPQNAPSQSKDSSEAISGQMNRGLQIAISKHNPDYSNWLIEADSTIKYYDLYTISIDSALKILEGCDGLLLSGGPDVAPSFYGKPGEAKRCEIDDKRDTLEMKIIEKARKMKMPIFGICRGEQILNIFYGGTLIVDIPKDFGKKITHRCDNPDKCMHRINIVKGTLLYDLIGVEAAESNSNHHQAVDKLADGFVVSATSADGLIEAFEWKGKDNPPNGEPFIMAVQWHPEKLKRDNPLSMPFANYFLMKAKEYRAKKLNL